MERYKRNNDPTFEKLKNLICLKDVSVKEVGQLLILVPLKKALIHSTMQFKINVISEDEEFAVKQSQQLKDWIEDDEELQGLTVKQERKELQEDDAGGGLEAILDVAVNFVSDSISQTIQPIASALQTWMVEKTKRSVSEFHVELENAQGKKFRIHSKNIGDNEKALIAEIIARFEGKEDFQYKITE